MGDAWTADYLKITGELDVDLRSNIAAKARALTIPPAWEMKEKVMLAVLGTRAASGESLNPQNFNRESRHRAERRQPGMQSPWPKRLERPE
jgi:hypothetical protein